MRNTTGHDSQTQSKKEKSIPSHSVIVASFIQDRSPSKSQSEARGVRPSLCTQRLHCPRSSLALQQMSRRSHSTHPITVNSPGIASPPLAAATCRSGLHALTLSNSHCLLVVNCRCSHTLLDLASHCKESLLYIRSVLG